jgi:hypothetical protein
MKLSRRKKECIYDDQACPRFWGRAYIGIWIRHYYMAFSCMGLSNSIEKEKSRMGYFGRFWRGIRRQGM